MRFVNNFRQVLATGLAVGATSMELDGGGSALSDASAAAPYRLTIYNLDAAGNESGWEVVEVTAASADTLTISGGLEGTSRPSGGWPAGTPVECRLTAGAANSFVVADLDPVIVGASAGIGAFNAGEAEASGAVVIGAAAYGKDATRSTAIGGNAGAQAPDAVAVADGSYASGQYSIAFGKSAFAGGTSTVALGESASCSGEYAVAIGAGISMGSGENIAIGSAPSCGGYDGQISIGRIAYAGADQAVAIGDKADNLVPGGLQINALPFIRATPSHPSGAVSPAATRQGAAQVVIATTAVDLTDGGATAILTMPANVWLFPDQIDVVITDADGAGGPPNINVGTAAGATDLLNATTVNSTAAGDRDVHTPASRHGVTAVHVSIDTAGSGTTYAAKVVIHGYVLEQ